MTFCCIWHCGDDHVHGRVLLSQLTRDGTDGQRFLVLSDKDFTRVQLKLYIRYLRNFCKKRGINTFLYNMAFSILELTPEPAYGQLKILVQFCIYHTIGTMKRCSNNYKFTTCFSKHYAETMSQYSTSCLNSLNFGYAELSHMQYSSRKGIGKSGGKQTRAILTP